VVEKASTVENITHLTYKVYTSTMLYLKENKTLYIYLQISLQM
jgi:hypothetical protein